ncbi:MAG: hypothetical protein K2X77_21305 [Candidatus Obscuribacterales bacterium]|nr:hypothetical protein [Candidatus Obscuribacterales bacterium]
MFDVPLSSLPQRRDETNERTVNGISAPALAPDQLGKEILLNKDYFRKQTESVDEQVNQLLRDEVYRALTKPLAKEPVKETYSAFAEKNQELKSLGNWIRTNRDHLGYDDFELMNKRQIKLALADPIFADQQSQDYLQAMHEGFDVLAARNSLGRRIPNRGIPVEDNALRHLLETRYSEKRLFCELVMPQTFLGGLVLGSPTMLFMLRSSQPLKWSALAASGAAVVGSLLGFAVGYSDYTQRDYERKYARLMIQLRKAARGSNP